MPQTINKDETSRPNLGRSTMNIKSEELIAEHAETTFYTMLGCAENATPEELKIAYRQLALAQHPDKGGNADKFHELQMAYDVLENQARRDAYDDELRRERDRAALVEGATSSNAPKKKAADAAPREKTAPTPGSKRSKKVEAQPGCNEWKIHGSGRGQLRMIEDGASPEAKAAVLFSKYQELPRNAEKKRDWLKGVRGEDKWALKAAAKVNEEKAKEKCAQWLSGGAAKAKPLRKEDVRREELRKAAAEKAVAAKSDLAAENSTAPEAAEMSTSPEVIGSIAAVTA